MVSEMARGVDIFPTVLDVVGLDPIPGLGGSSLLRLMRGYYDDFQVAISQKALAQGRFSIAIRSNRWKLFENRLYDLVADPGENDERRPASTGSSGKRCDRGCKRLPPPMRWFLPARSNWTRSYDNP